MKLLNRIKQLYQENTNVIQYLRNLDGREQNAVEDILISYDFQAGTYTEKYLANPQFTHNYCLHLASVLDNLCSYDSLLEVGIGEATTLGPLIKSLKRKPKRCYGFDISWSRVKYARKLLRDLNLEEVELFTGDLFCTPLKDSSIDIVYTSHSIEPNGGKEKEALCELYRITKKYLILLEPSYEFACLEAKKRMLSHGYVTKLYSTAKQLGYKVIEHRLFEVTSNPLNPTAIMIIEKNTDMEVDNPLCCPLTKTPIIKDHNAFFSKESLLVYPIIDEIPCLLTQNAVVATKFLE